MIKSMEDLRKIREEYKDKVNLRQNFSNVENRIEILIGMATCGISSGARETLNAFVEELKEQEVSNAKVVSVGCLGYCHSEPTVQVNMPGREPVFYGNVKKDKVHEIVEKHIKGGNPVKDLVLAVSFTRA